jgi:hypothetical protein
MRARVNHVTTEQAQDAPGVVLGTFPINSVPATVLFDSEHHIHSLPYNLWQSIIYL